MKNIKFVSIIMLLVMCLQGIMPNVSLGAPDFVSNGKICFQNISTMRKFTTNLKDYQNMPIIQKDLTLCNQDVTVLKQKETFNLTLIDGLKKDKVLQDTVYKDTQTSLINKQKEVDKLKEEQPSRLTWFLIGLGSALLVGLLGAIAVK
jgi:hypothetical protein